MFLAVVLALNLAFLSVESVGNTLPKKACFRFYGASMGLTALHAKKLFDQNRHQESAWMLARIGDTARHQQLMSELKYRLLNSEVSDFKRLHIEEWEGMTSEIYIVTFKDGLKAIFKPHPRHWKEKSQQGAALANPFSEKVASDFSEALEMNSVPLTVIRTFENMEGSLHAFIDFKVFEGYSYAEMQVPKLRSWFYETVYNFEARQTSVIKLFQYLVFNMDGNNGVMGNSGNVKSWLAAPRLDPNTLPGEASGKVALDFGASFQHETSPKGRWRPYNEADNEQFSLKGTKTFYLNLKHKLTEKKIQELMRPYFSKEIIKQAIQRRSNLLSSLEKRITEITDLTD